MKLHYLQHIPFENPGSILKWAKKNDFTITSTQLYKNEVLPQQDDFDWLVVMGGPMNIYEEDSYPWLIKEKQFICEAIKNNKIVIGLCLGAQLIADVLGGKVTRNPLKEIGWMTVKFTKEVQNIPLFSEFPKELTVFQWHGDTFSTLSEEVTLLAESDACKHQAFCYKNRVFGFQFHLENTRDIIEDLVKNCADEMVPGPYVQTPNEVMSHPEYIIEDNEWMNIFLTKLDDMDRKGRLI